MSYFVLAITLQFYGYIYIYIYIYIFNNKDTAIVCEICSKLTIKTVREGGKLTQS